VSRQLVHGVDTHRDADSHGKHAGHQGQFKRGGEALPDQARDLRTLAQAQTEFALCRVNQEVPELHEEGLVQAQVDAQLPDLVGLGVLPEQEDDRVADVLEQHEGDEGHGNHDNHCLEQTAQNEGEHFDRNGKGRC